MSALCISNGAAESGDADNAASLGEAGACTGI